MAIKIWPFDGNKQIPRTQSSGVDTDPGHQRRAELIRMQTEQLTADNLSNLCRGHGFYHQIPREKFTAPQGLNTGRDSSQPSGRG